MAQREKETWLEQVPERRGAGFLVLLTPERVLRKVLVVLDGVVRLEPAPAVPVDETLVPLRRLAVDVADSSKPPAGRWLRVQLVLDRCGAGWGVPRRQTLRISQRLPLAREVRGVPDTQPVEGGPDRVGKGTHGDSVRGGPRGSPSERHRCVPVVRVGRPRPRVAGHVQPEREVPLGRVDYSAATSPRTNAA
jgi:hypothetical protein